MRPYRQAQRRLVLNEDLASSAASLLRVNDPSAPEPSKSVEDSEGPVEHATHAEPPPSAVATSQHDLTSAAPDIEGADSLDLAAIERDLNDVETALERLNDGNYWTDEITGEPIADDVLAAHPTARTATPKLG